MGVSHEGGCMGVVQVFCIFMPHLRCTELCGRVPLVKHFLLSFILVLATSGTHVLHI